MAEWRVLLVEDDRQVGDLLRIALMAAGYAVEWVTTAETARRHVETTPYDVVVADWRLDGEDGMAVVGQAADLGIKTIVISGYLFQLSDADDRHEYLMKPMRPNELIDVIERLLGPAQT